MKTVPVLLKLSVCLIVFNFSLSICVAQDIVQMVKRTKPSVVTVAPQDAFGIDQGIGSGFFIDKTTIVTNYHVIDEAYSVVIRNNDSVEMACPYMILKDSALDIAVIKVAVPDSIEVTPIPLATLVPEQGQNIYVVGNPLGFQQTVSNGIVSSIRVIEDEGKLIQFTAAISEGNSGGPLLNAEGEVVGIVTLTYHGGQNLNFARPIEFLKELGEESVYPFRTPIKSYLGVDLDIREAFTVDTTLRGIPPSNLSAPEKNEWRLLTAGLRYRWDSTTVQQNMRRLMRGLKRNYPEIDPSTDTISMRQAMGMIYESIGYNKAASEHPPEIQSTIDELRYALGIITQASRFSDEGKVVSSTAGTIVESRQIWVEIEKGAQCAVMSMYDTSYVKDIDVVVFQWSDDQWKPVGSETGEEVVSIAAFEAPETAEYAVVWRLARVSEPKPSNNSLSKYGVKTDEEPSSKTAIFGSIVIVSE